MKLIYYMNFRFHAPISYHFTGIICQFLPLVNACDLNIPIIFV